MNIAGIDAQHGAVYELPAPLTFQHVFQSCPYWVGGTAGAIPQVVKPLRKSSRKQSYLLNVNDRQLVLSVASAGQSGSSIIEHAARAGVAPAVLYNSLDHGFVVTEYLDGWWWSAPDFQVLSNIERLADLLQRLHVLPGEGPVFSMLEQVYDYWDAINLESIGVPRYLLALQQTMNKLINGAEDDYPERVVCHNHLLLSRVIETEAGLQLVGWEYAALNDPYYDLAVLVHNNGLNDVQLEHLLNCYAGASGLKEREHFYASYAIYMYLEALGCLLKGGCSPTPDQETDVEMKVDILVALLHQLGV